ncbi:hypothetical protein Ctob_009659 [Chrysochromulina tobinii]|uniref:Uncharacterized protein n=1 Tax=Chrysochromulina tobinii TaxID=1460289 RepID=A0A0M0JX25_9EUKA|nr:hypothetical protein Ctob_009659 [Chrysochromulina tobinii]|eukprot:KOO30872.1 hypothetical protein Ctob_009659 [Chrysochromulina sp. CCMP291]
MRTYSSILIASSTCWPPMGTVTTARPFSVAAAAHPPANAIATCLSSASEPNVQHGPLFPGCRRLCHGFEPWTCGVLLHPRVPRRRRRHKRDLNAWSLRAERGAHAHCRVRLTAACLAFDRVDPVLLLELLRDTRGVLLDPLTPACHA